jgi:hypothetical protein
MVGTCLSTDGNQAFHSFFAVRMSCGTKRPGTTAEQVGATRAGRLKWASAMSTHLLETGIEDFGLAVVRHVAEHLDGDKKVRRCRDLVPTSSAASIRAVDTPDFCPVSCSKL